MHNLRRISSALNLSAIVCLLAFNGWLQYNHGHHPVDGLFPGGTCYSRAVITESTGERHACGAPEITAHGLRLVFPHDCLICSLFNWSSEPQYKPARNWLKNNPAADAPLKEINLSFAPLSTSRLRAPPLSA